MHRAVLFLIQLMRWGCVQQLFPISDHDSQLQKVPGSRKQCDLQRKPAWLGPLHLSCVVSADVTPGRHFFISNQGGELKKPAFSRCLEPSEGQWSTQGGAEGHMDPSASLKTWQKDRKRRRYFKTRRRRTCRKGPAGTSLRYETFTEF